jgi:hypothetical protein
MQCPFKDSPDRTGVAPVLAVQPNHTKSAIFAYLNLGCRKEWIVQTP